MRTSKRLKGLQGWMQENLCNGRSMKAPGERGDITQIVMQEPKCYISWFPMRPDLSGDYQSLPANVTPSILIMPDAGHVRYTQEERFDRYNGIKRSKDFAQELNVDILFSIYEPGVRLPGFIDSRDPETGQFDFTLLKEGTEEGLETLLDWMDELRDLLLAYKSIPGTDLVVKESSMQYSLYTDQSYVMDKRPLYFGFMKVEFECYAEYPAVSERDSLLL